MHWKKNKLPPLMEEHMAKRYGKCLVIGDSELIDITLNEPDDGYVTREDFGCVMFIQRKQYN